MSAEADLKSTFLEFQRRYNWSDEETINNLLSIYSDLEWDILWPVPKVTWEELGRLEHEAMKENLYG